MRRNASGKAPARGGFALVVAAILCGSARPVRAQAVPPSATSSAPAPIRLVVMVSVDQMTPDQLVRLEPWLEGGLGRFARKGLVFSSAALRHGDTETGPGHASYGTGLDPRRHGIVSNDWLAVDARKSTYCFGDPDSRAVTSSGVLAEPASSPRNFRADGVADRLRAAHPGAKTLAISSKDRSAIGMSGRRADLALWWDKKRGGFLTSTWYASDLPQWLDDANAKWRERLSRFRDGWSCEIQGDVADVLARSGAAPDECDGEWGKPGQRSFPHRAPASGGELGAKELATLALWVYEGPAGDVLVLDLARDAVAALELGRDDVPDLLSISLSSCDTVGHLYGPRSVEVTDVLLRADRELGRLFDLLDAAAGPGRWIAALSADHGVLDLPERIGAPARRITGRETSDTIKAAAADVEKRFGKSFFLAQCGRGLRLSLSAMKEAGADPAEVRRAYAAALAEHGSAWLEAVWTLDELREIARGGEARSELARFEARSFDEERTSDLVLLHKRQCVLGMAAGTTHGTPYEYDRSVPLAFYGPGFERGVRADAAASIDAVPTLLARLGIAEPGLDGRDLLAPDASASEAGTKR